MNAPEGASVRLVRTLIAAQWLCMLCSAATWHVTLPAASPEVQACVRLVTTRLHPVRDFLLELPLGLVFLVANVGVFLSWRRGPLLYVLSTVAGQLLVVAEGPTCAPSGWSNFFYQATVLAMGMTVGVLLSSPRGLLWRSGRSGS